MNEEKLSETEKSESTSPINPANIKVKEKSKQFAEALGIEAVIVVFILLIVIMILNYFNIIRLSTNMPAIFGWLPHRVIVGSNTQISQEQNVSQSENSSQPSTFLPGEEKFFITCPVSPGFCADGKSVYNKTNREVEGLGYIQLGPELAIYAVFDGQTSSKTEKVDGMDKTTITLTGENGLVATYIFQGLPQKEKGTTDNKVKQAEIIGLSGGAQLTLFDFTAQQYSLAFSLASSENNENIPVIPREDGRALNLR